MAEIASDLPSRPIADRLLSRYFNSAEHSAGIN